MPLVDWQIALGTLVATRASAGVHAPRESFSSLQLTSSERDWLATIPESAGFQVTCAIQRWWRETRLRSLARLTLAALGAAQAAQMMSAYLQESLCSSLFFLPETLAFLQFVASHTQHPHHRALAQFEGALLSARETAAHEPDEDLKEMFIEFAAPPEELLEAVLIGQVLPEPDTTRYGVIVSPQFPQLWRLATEEERSAYSQANNSDTGLKPTYFVPEAFSM
ncbi:MAG TPA: hypothetical protein VFZ34_29130 [Blastocatellia bacterium]|nr:hypothetical protein [Blastocatellia bacterium]